VPGNAHTRSKLRAHPTNAHTFVQWGSHLLVALSLHRGEAEIEAVVPHRLRAKETQVKGMGEGSVGARPCGAKRVTIMARPLSPRSLKLASAMAAPLCPTAIRSTAGSERRS
jgi:hypothetical protein